MNFGVAFFGVCGISAVGVLDELENMEIRPTALFLNDNSILPAYMYACGFSYDIIIKKCQAIRGLTWEKCFSDIGKALRNIRPRMKLYYSTPDCDYTTDAAMFPNMSGIKDVCEGVDAMLRIYRQPSDDIEMHIQTWPLTNMGCERILLVSPSCCCTDYKCSMHIRLPAYDKDSMQKLRVSYYQGYRAAEHERARIYEKLLF